MLVIGFAAVIVLGAALLTLPQASADGKSLPFLDALFTATSATCVTGLVVVDTGTHFTLLGQLIIITLIQLGGLGFMSMSILIAILMGQKIGLRSRILVQESFNQLNLAGVVKLTKKVIATTLAIEFIGAVLLTLAWSKYLPFPKALYFGFFHAISSFCNAGFDLVGEFRSVTIYNNDPTICLPIAFLIILGGLGFTVINEVINYPKQKYLSLHSKMVLRVTAVLLIVGTILFFLLEYYNSHTLAPLSFSSKWLNAFFQSVTSRTAGYNSIAIGEMTNASLFVMVILMFIGASPGSTGGGIKTSTFGAMLLAIRANINGQEDAEFCERRISRESVQRSFTVTALAMFLVIIATIILNVSETGIVQQGGQSFLNLLFEVVSAFGTVGLTTGITTQLSPIGKLLIAALMFIGRLGPLTVAVALAARKRKSSLRYPEDKIIVG